MFELKFLRKSKKLLNIIYSFDLTKKNVFIRIILLTGQNIEIYILMKDYTC